MSSILSTPRKRIVQVVHSIPHYAWEVLHPSPSHSVVEWLRYKFPTRFKLSELPRKLTLEITNYCNLGCPHCYREVMERPLGFMRLDLVEKIAAQLREVPYCELKIVGLGEPALHPQFEEILEILRPVAPKSALYTNGALFRKMTPEALVESGIRLIIVSIDGTDRESFDSHRPGGDYDLLWKEVGRFREVREAFGRRWPTIEIRHVIHPGETSADLERFRRRVRKVADTVKSTTCCRSSARLSSQPGRSRDAATSTAKCMWSGTARCHSAATFRCIVTQSGSEAPPTCR